MDNDFLENPLVKDLDKCSEEPAGHFAARSEGEGLEMVPHAQNGDSLHN